MTKLEALKSPAFVDIVQAIRRNSYELAEFLLLEMECDLDKIESRFTESDLKAIKGAMQECWIRVEENAKVIK